MADLTEWTPHLDEIAAIATGRRRIEIAGVEPIDLGILAVAVCVGAGGEIAIIAADSHSGLLEMRHGRPVATPGEAAQMARKRLPYGGLGDRVAVLLDLAPGDERAATATAAVEAWVGAGRLHRVSDDEADTWADRLSDVDGLLDEPPLAGRVDGEVIALARSIATGIADSIFNEADRQRAAEARAAAGKYRKLADDLAAENRAREAARRRATFHVVAGLSAGIAEAFTPSIKH